MIDDLSSILRDRYPEIFSSAPFCEIACLLGGLD